MSPLREDKISRTKTLSYAFFFFRRLRHLKRIESFERQRWKIDAVRKLEIISFKISLPNCFKILLFSSVFLLIYFILVCLEQIQKSVLYAYYLPEYFCLDFGLNALNSNISSLLRRFLKDIIFIFFKLKLKHTLGEIITQPAKYVNDIIYPGSYVNIRRYRVFSWVSAQII